MVIIRCKSCKRYYGIAHNACPKCGHKSTKKDYYVRLDNKDTFAGDSLTVARKLDADLKEAKRKNRNKLSEYYESTESISFQNFIDKYYAPHYNAKNKDYADVSPKIEYFCKQFGYKDLNSIRSIDIERAIYGLPETFKPRTRNYYLSVIKRIFNYAIEINVAAVSPVKMKPTKLDNKRTRFLSTDEEARLLDACKESRNKRLLPMVMIALYTGMRKGELQQLTPKNIVNGQIYLTGDMTKSSTGRVIPIHDKIKAYLHGDFDYNTEIKDSFNNALERAGIKDFRFHDLRHTFASKLAQAGVELYTIKELLGHSSIEMTQRYAHLSPHNHKNAINILK